MHVLEIDPSPFHALPHFVAGPRRLPGPQPRELPVLRGRVDRLPAGLGALVLASDLQGRMGPTDESELLGVGVAEGLVGLAPAGSLPPQGDIGVVLAGDLHAGSLERRGGGGAVTPVWAAFAERFRWVVGVAGNHDAFTDPPSGAGALPVPGSARLLDGEIVERDGLRIAGVGGIFGRPTKPFRKRPEHFLELVDDLLGREPDLLVLHESPGEAKRPRQGQPALLEAVGRGPATLVVSGHCHWPDPLLELPNGGQVLNVDSRVVVLRPRGEP